MLDGKAIEAKNSWKAFGKKRSLFVDWEEANGVSADCISTPAELIRLHHLSKPAIFFNFVNAIEFDGRPMKLRC